MSYNQMIHEYLDTGLKQPQEDALFQALASDQVLRGDFQQQLSIMKIAANDMNSISPPIEATNAVFSSLGFTIPSGGAPTSTVVNETRRKPGAAIFASASGVGVLNIFKDNFSTLGSIAVAAMISTFLFMTFDKELPTAEVSAIGVTLAQNYYDDASHSTLPIVSSIDKTVEKTTNSSRNSSNYQPVRSSSIPIAASNEKGKENSTEVFAANNDLATNIEQKTIKEINKINEHGYTIVKVNRLNTSDASALGFPEPNFVYEEKSGFALELRGANNPNETALLNDMMIGVNFEFIDDFHAIGLIGNERYVVRVANPLSAGEQVQYSNESMISFMVGLRYAPDELILDGMIVPYIQASGGGISNGFAGGFESGLILNLNSNYSFLVGYGKQFAKYNFEGNLYNTNKDGINVGLRYSF
ncbi:MAG: hypothetical protein WC121_08440 [Candidatus Kapaibacterium sp.]